VDVLTRALECAPGSDLAAAVKQYLQEGRTATARELARKAVVLLTPANRLGEGSGRRLRPDRARTALPRSSSAHSSGPANSRFHDRQLRDIDAAICSLARGLRELMGDSRIGEQQRRLRR
jgi:hypothetical protein